MRRSPGTLSTDLKESASPLAQAVKLGRASRAAKNSLEMGFMSELRPFGMLHDDIRRVSCGQIQSGMTLITRVQAQAHDARRPAGAVIARIRDVLIVRAQLYPPSDLEAVIGLEGLLIAIVQRTIAEDETAAAGGEIVPVFRGETLVTDACRETVVAPAPMGT